MIALPWPFRRAPRVRPARDKGRFFRPDLLGLSVTILIAALMGHVVYPYMVQTVPTGFVGVLWHRFNGLGFYCWCLHGRGTVLDPRELRDEGLHVIFPWNILYLYDLRLQTKVDTYNAISKDGVSLSATISTRFQLKHDDLPILHKFVGPDYAAKVLFPEIGSRAREIISQYTAEEVYSTKREAIEAAIRTSAQKRLGERLDRLLQMQASEEVPQEPGEKPAYSMRDAIEVFDTLVLGIELPPSIVAAINRKLAQYYITQEYDFRIARERKESERKRIEAAGIYDFQRTVSERISDSYLRWRGIEATLQLAHSPNAKIVVMGNRKQGLPVIDAGPGAGPAR